MFIDEYLAKNMECVKNMGKKEMEYDLSFKYWSNHLLEYSMKIFTLKGLPDEIPSHEPDVISFLNGYVPIVLLTTGKWCAAAESGLMGITNYYDIFEYVNFTTPLHFGKREIGKNAFIIRNTELKNPLLPLINRYASILAHIDVSLVCELVNIREHSFCEAVGESQKNTYDRYFDNLYQGKIGSIVNYGFSMLKHEFKHTSQQENLKLWDLRNNVFCSFLEEIGVKKQNEKRERFVSEEVSANRSLLRLNIANMHRTRQKDWDKFNEKTGYNVKVICNVDYDDDEGNKTENLKEGESVEI